MSRETANKPYALDLDRGAWESWAQSVSLPRYVGRQVHHWIFRKQVCDPMIFTDLAPKCRQLLLEAFDWTLPEISQALRSADQSEKILFRTRDGLFAECVVMPSENRVTVCVSSQVGCRMACTFCQTGKIGFSRNLSSGEILAQIFLAQKRLEEADSPRTHVTNVVFMGMGEPLDNFDAVAAACRQMISEDALGLSRHKVTVSTCGLVPEIRRLGVEVPVSLAISLHSADEEARSAMMPVNKRYSLAELKSVLLDYPVQTRNGITFEYVMIDGVNDSLTHARKLVRFLHGLKAKVNLIPMNEHPGSPMKESAAERIRDFQKHLTDRSIPAPVRYSRGQDVSAACGQLAMKKAGELNSAPRSVALARRREHLSDKRRGQSVSEGIRPRVPAARGRPENPGFRA